MKRIGYFRELRHGEPDGPSLIAARDRLDPALRTQVAGYLKAGGVLATTGALTDDWFTKERRVAPLESRTDGVWVWPADLAYYVEHYGTEVPAEFIRHTEAHGWVAPMLTDEELIDIARALRSPRD
jgi:hypothetical protein